MTRAPIHDPICIQIPHQNNARLPWSRMIVEMVNLVKLIRMPLTILTKIWKQRRKIRIRKQVKLDKNTGPNNSLSTISNKIVDT